MRYGSVCSGIEAASVAWEPLGWTPAWFAEIEPFPSAVLAHHWPHTPNLGDMTKLARRVLLGEVSAPDVLVGGTPCQAFSVAGMREGLADARGQLTMKYVELADAIDLVRSRAGDPEAVVVWENVPGVLSDKSNAFGCFLGALAGEDRELQPSGKRWTNAGCVYGPTRAIAWRVLDAQYFGVAQRRRRVFVVASARKGFDPAAVLFEREGVRRDSPPSRGPGKEFAGHAGGGAESAVCFGGGRTGGPIEAAACLVAKGQKLDFEVETFAVQAVTGDITHALNTANNGKGSSEDGTGRGVPTIAFSAKDYGGDAMENLSPTLRAGGHLGSHANASVMPAVTVALRGREGGATAELGGDVATALRASTGGGDKPHVLTTVGFNARQDPDCWAERTGPLGTDGSTQAVAHVQAMPTMVSGGSTEGSHNQLSGQFREEYVVPTTNLAVRRLTPVECERLQGFPDGHTDVPYRNKPAADGPRYKAIGNSKAIPCVAWLGRRIALSLNRSDQPAAH